MASQYSKRLTLNVAKCNPKQTNVDKQNSQLFIHVYSHRIINKESVNNCVICTANIFLELFKLNFKGVFWKSHAFFFFLFCVAKYKCPYFLCDR